MRALQLKELCTLIRGGADVRNMVIEPCTVLNSKGQLTKRYQIHFLLSDRLAEEPAHIITAKNERQTWSSMNKLMEFIEDTFPMIEQTTILVKRETNEALESLPADAES